MPFEEKQSHVQTHTSRTANPTCERAQNHQYRHECSQDILRINPLHAKSTKESAKGENTLRGRQEFGRFRVAVSGNFVGIVDKESCE